MPSCAVRARSMDKGATMVCEVAYAQADRQLVLSVTLPHGASARDALNRALELGLSADCPQIEAETAVLGVFGKVVKPDYRLQAGDRVEIYRPLAADPRSARRARVK